MGKLNEKLRELRERLGLSQDQLAKRLGVSQQAVANWEAGLSAPLRRRREDLASALGVSLAELMGQTSTHVIALHPDDPLPEGSVPIKVHKVRFAAGDGHQVTYEVDEEEYTLPYQLSWLREIGVRPENARRFTVSGDSMEPVIFAGDKVLVDISDNDPRRIIDGKVYAIRYGDNLRIKRLYRRLDGTLILRSDNPAYKDEEVPPQLAEEHISIIGRVRDKGGAGGL